MKKPEVAMVCKLMPYYRLGVFQKLTESNDKYTFNFYGDVKEQGGIKQIPYSFATEVSGKKIRWIKTRNYFYKPERLLWQTGIIKQIFKKSNKVFVFEGAIAHYPIWLFAFLCKIFRKKVLYWTHGNRGLDYGIKKMLRVVFFRYLGNGLLLYGNKQREIMIKDGYNPDKLFVIYNSLQADYQLELFSKTKNEVVQKLKSNLFKNPENYTFIFIGRLRKEKEVLKIIQIMVALKNDGIETNSIFIGAGPEKEAMLTYGETEGLSKNIHFTGELYDEKEIVVYFKMADLMLSPGNVGLNCIHSLAYGVPVITHGNFAYQNPEVEAIDAIHTGAFYSYGNFDDMFLKTKEWIKNSPKKEIVVKQCQHKIKELYNSSHQARCIENAVEKILS